MAIENRDLEAGTKLIARYMKDEYRAEVVAGEEGKVKSPSSAGTAITSKACNGWAFWSIETDSAQGGPEEPERSEKPGEDSEDAETPEQTPAAGFRRVPNQKGVEDGEVRLYCDARQKSFTSPIGQQPETCPESHYPGEASEA